MERINLAQHVSTPTPPTTAQARQPCSFSGTMHDRLMIRKYHLKKPDKSTKEIANWFLLKTGSKVKAKTINEHCKTNHVLDKIKILERHLHITSWKGLKLAMVTHQIVRRLAKLPPGTVHTTDEIQSAARAMWDADPITVEKSPTLPAEWFEKYLRPEFLDKVGYTISLKEDTKAMEDAKLATQMLKRVSKPSYDSMRASQAQDSSSDIVEKTSADSHMHIADSVVSSPGTTSPKGLNFQSHKRQKPEPVNLLSLGDESATRSLEPGMNNVARELEEPEEINQVNPEPVQSLLLSHTRPEGITTNEPLNGDTTPTRNLDAPPAEIKSKLQDAHSLEDERACDHWHLATNTMWPVNPRRMTTQDKARQNSPFKRTRQTAEEDTQPHFVLGLFSPPMSDTQPEASTRNSPLIARNGTSNEQTKGRCSIQDVNYAGRQTCTADTPNSNGDISQLVTDVNLNESPGLHPTVTPTTLQKPIRAFQLEHPPPSNQHSTRYYPDHQNEHASAFHSLTLETFTTMLREDVPRFNGIFSRLGSYALEFRRDKVAEELHLSLKSLKISDPVRFKAILAAAVTLEYRMFDLIRQSFLSFQAAQFNTQRKPVLPSWTPNGSLPHSGIVTSQSYQDRYQSIPSSNQPYYRQRLQQHVQHPQQPHPQQVMMSRNQPDIQQRTRQQEQPLGDPHQPLTQQQHQHSQSYFHRILPTPLPLAQRHLNLGPLYPPPVQLNHHPRLRVGASNQSQPLPHDPVRFSTDHMHHPQKRPAEGPPNSTPVADTERPQHCDPPQKRQRSLCHHHTNIPNFYTPYVSSVSALTPISRAYQSPHAQPPVLLQTSREPANSTRRFSLQRQFALTAFLHPGQTSFKPANSIKITPSQTQEAPAPIRRTPGQTSHEPVQLNNVPAPQRDPAPRPLPKPGRPTHEPASLDSGTSTQSQPAPAPPAHEPANSHATLSTPNHLAPTPSSNPLNPSDESAPSEEAVAAQRLLDLASTSEDYWADERESKWSGVLRSGKSFPM